MKTRNIILLIITFAFFQGLNAQKLEVFVKTESDSVKKELFKNPVSGKIYEMDIYFDIEDSKYKGEVQFIVKKHDSVQLKFEQLEYFSEKYIHLKKGKGSVKIEFYRENPFSPGNYFCQIIHDPFYTRIPIEPMYYFELK
jgi:hypothetical protein